MARPEKIRLGDLLIQQNLITGGQLEFALGEQKRNGRRLGRVLVDNGFITEERMSESLARQLHIPYINLKNHVLNLDLVRQLPESQARRFRALPLEERQGVLLIGMADPTDLAAFDELGQTLKRTIDIAVVTEGQLLETIERVYRRTEEISGLARDLIEEIGARVVSFGAATDTVGVEDMPAVNLLQSVLSDAVQAKASAIHFDLEEGRVSTRFRIDGCLQLRAGIDIKIASAVVHRLKLMSGMDTSGKRLPQDGHLKVNVRGQTLDVPVSILPTQHGESLIMRMPAHGGHPPSLDALGLPAEMLGRLRDVIRRGDGMVLVADSGGRDNVSTLYAALAEIGAADRKIVTVEDPVEYSLPGAAQVQVDERGGMGFPRALRSALRQDPDVILVGELRDMEIAQMSARAAASGCLVFSAVYARDAADAVLFLENIGVPKYMVAASVRAILAKRLLRGVCGNCGESHKVSPQEEAWLKRAGVPPERWSGLRQGRGCARCNGTGYSGRIAVYEMLEMDLGLAETAMHADTSHFAQAVHARMKGHSLLDQSLAQMEQGRTTVAEVMRMAFQENSR